VRSNRVLRKHSIGRELQTTACSISKCMINLSNKGSSGVDGMSTKELMDYLVKYWSETKELLLKGTYNPQLVRGVKIPKKSGGDRLLGIPTVIDRLIQQSIHQVLNPIWEREFSRCSYGFRPKHN
jgi:RNA-directed DNA polymerase